MRTARQAARSLASSVVWRLTTTGCAVGLSFTRREQSIDLQATRCRMCSIMVARTRFWASPPPRRLHASVFWKVSRLPQLCRKCCSVSTLSCYGASPSVARAAIKWLRRRLVCPLSVCLIADEQDAGLHKRFLDGRGLRFGKKEPLACVHRLGRDTPEAPPAFGVPRMPYIAPNWEKWNAESASAAAGRPEWTFSRCLSLICAKSRNGPPVFSVLTPNQNDSSSAIGTQKVPS